MTTFKQYLEQFGMALDTMLDEDEIAAVVSEIEASAAEACLENPDVNEDDVYHEIMNSVLATATPEMRAEVRSRLGF